MSDGNGSGGNPASVRPRQVTVATWVGGGVSLALLLACGELIVKLRTVEAREGIADFLADQGETVFKLSVDQAVTVARVGLLVCGAAAAAMLVLAVFAFRRDKSARVGMTVVAVPLLICGIFVDPFLAAFVVVSAVLLWTGPASDWFAGRAIRTAPVKEKPAPPATVAAPTDRPAPYVGQAAAFGAPAGPSTYGTAPLATSSTSATPDADRRPARVVAAVGVTWAASAVVVLLMLVVAFTATSDNAEGTLRQLLADNAQAREAGLTVRQLAIASAVMSGVLAAWAVAAMVLAAFAFCGHDWARIMLAISAGTAGFASLVGVVANPGFILVVLACVTVLVLLFHRDSSAWFAARKKRPATPAQPRVQPPSQPW